MSSTRRRVAITGIGLVTPLGNDQKTNWSNLIAGNSGVRAITKFNADALPVRIAGEVRDFDPGIYIEKKDLKKMDLFIHYAIAAAQMAVDDSSLPSIEFSSTQVGVILGVGLGGIGSIEETVAAYQRGGIRKVSPFFIPRVIANMAPAHVSMRFGCKGVSHTITSACASGGHAVGEAARMIRDGFQDVMIAGGAEAAVTDLGIGGFAAMRALSTRNDEPMRASRPFDLNRDGFVVAEGAAVLILEDLDSARRRSARIYAEVIGAGATSDAYHMTMPAPGGEGAARCMLEALRDAQISPEAVDYINAHGTSTPHNDSNETVAVRTAFGPHANKLAISSTKSMTGHALGAAGAIEAAYTSLALYHGVIPPTINYEDRDPACDLDFVPNHARSARIEIALSNAFGFGGMNSCLALRRIDTGQ